MAAGDTDRFWQLARLLTVPPGSDRYEREQEADLTEHPRWAALAEPDRELVLEAARRYVIEGRCAPERWLGQHKRFHPAEAGFRALVLMARLVPNELATIPGDAWRQWAPILVAWRSTMGDKPDALPDLIELAKADAIREMQEAVLTLSRAAIEAEELFLPDPEASLVWGEALAQGFAGLLDDSAAGPARPQILGLLARNEPVLLRGLLTGWLDPSSVSEDADRAAVAIRLLLAHDARAAWPTLSRCLGGCPSVVTAALHHSALVDTRQVPDLDEPDLASLFLWLEREFPSSEDPQFDDAHMVGPRESIAHWRDAILMHLRDLGTEAAATAITNIQRQLPALTWLGHIAETARASVRFSSWRSRSPADLLRLSASARSRLVDGPTDLLNLVGEALDEIQLRLQGQTPEAHLLWDTFSRRPKSEPEISNYLRIRLHDLLADRAVAVNREVEVRQTHPTGVGERTDLHIQATALDPTARPDPRVVTVVGEVKGAWHADVLTAMRTQLVDRYMRDVGTHHGLYVVAWFGPEGWDPRDRRRSAVARHERDELRVRLEEQAAELLSDGLRIRVLVLDSSWGRPAH